MKHVSFIAVLAISIFTLSGCGNSVEPDEVNVPIVVESQAPEPKATRTQQSLHECILAIDEATLTRMTTNHEISREEAYALARELCGYPLHIYARSIEGYEEFAARECRQRSLCK